jgi:hypothetical protein
MRREGNAVGIEIAGGGYLDTVDSSGRKTREPGTKKKKKAYKAPSFRFEPVFEVSALSCGKVHATQGGCRFSRKVS